MISKTIGFRGLAYFQTHPYGFEAVAPSSNMFSKGDLFKNASCEAHESQHHKKPWTCLDHPLNVASNVASSLSPPASLPGRDPMEIDHFGMDENGVFHMGPSHRLNVFKPPCFFPWNFGLGTNTQLFRLHPDQKSTSPGSIRPTFDVAPKIGSPPLQDEFSLITEGDSCKNGTPSSRVQWHLKECGKTDAINHSTPTIWGWFRSPIKMRIWGMVYGCLWHWVDPTLGCRYFLKSKQWTCVEAELEHPFYGEIRNIRLDSLCALRDLWEELRPADVCPSMSYIPAKSSHQRPTWLGWSTQCIPMPTSSQNPAEDVLSLSVGDDHPKWDGNIYIYILLYHYILIVHIYSYIKHRSLDTWDNWYFWDKSIAVPDTDTSPQTPRQICRNHEKTSSDHVEAVDKWNNHGNL